MASIVVYDSGVGGLTIYQDIVKKCPNHQIIFVSDNAAFPYGTKTIEDLSHRVLSVAHSIDERYSPDILVVACNTASTVVLPLLRERFSFDVVGVVPAIKPAAQISITKRICLLATPGTISRPYTDSLIEQFASNCDVLKIASASLVDLAESKLFGLAIDLKKLEIILEPLIHDTSIDVLILACTHFPLLNDEITQVLQQNNRQITLVDSSLAVALRVVKVLEELSVQTLLAGDQGQAARLAVFTSRISNEIFMKNLKGFGFDDFDFLDVN